MEERQISNSFAWVTATSLNNMLTPAQSSTLLHCLFEEATANGGHFASPDTDLLFRRAFLDDWEDGEKPTLKALQDLARLHTLTNNSNNT